MYKRQVFYLKKPNPNAVNLLTFPIASTNDDENGYPIGRDVYKRQVVIFINQNVNF